MRMAPFPFFFLLLAALPGAFAQPATELSNRFGDPFFRIASALPQCPRPLGPFITGQEQRVQSHHRAEKGTTCWLAGQCANPNAYAYDAGIAAALRSKFALHPAMKEASLWITVQ